MIAVAVWIALRWLLLGTAISPDLVGLLFGVSAAVIAVCAWQDLSPTQEQWRTPFASAVAYVAAFTLYAAMLPEGLAAVTGLTLDGSVAFLAEFATGLAAPLALIAMPGMKAMMVMAPWRRPNQDAPRQAYFRCVVTLVVGFICAFSMVGPMVQSIPASAEAMTTPWGDMLGALASAVFFLSLMAVLALAWEQMAHDE